MANEDKASRYHRLRRRADLLSTAMAGVSLAALVGTGGHVWLRNQAMAVVGFLPGASAIPGSPGGPGTIAALASATLAGLAVLLLLALVETPVAWYQGFLLDHRYGLSTQSLRRWLADQAKAIVLSLVLGGLGIAVVYAAILWLDAWWWLGAAGMFGLAVVGLVQVAPVVLLPWFYAFKPLDRPELAARLLALAARAGARIGGVFEWTLSDHTTRANAALAGIGATRRILLSDTLLASYSDDEIEVVLAHELAHHVHHDIWRGVALQLGLITAGFYVAHVALTGAGGALGLAGPSDAAGVPLLLMIGGGWSLLTSPVSHAASRAQERRADRFALDATGQVQAFVSAMRRLSQQNLAEEYPSPLVQWLFYSHPPIRERIAAARQWEPSRVAAARGPLGPSHQR